MVRLKRFNKIKNIIFFPSGLGQKKPGLENTPSIIRDCIINKSKNKKIKLPNMYWIDCERSNNIYSNLNTLYHVNQQINGKRINIGGDHSMSIATVASSLNNYPNLKLIWIDAHADINTSYSSPSNNMHGMPLSYLSNLDEDDNFDFIYNHINLKNILYIGVRDLDKFEKEVYNHSNYITGTTIDYSFLKKVSDFIKDDPIHISFDVDSIDPIYIPSTGTKVKNGLSVQKAKMLLDFLYKYKKNQIVNIDLCELNLSIGSIEDSKLSLNNTLHLFSKYI